MNRHSQKAQYQQVAVQIISQMMVAPRNEMRGIARRYANAAYRVAHGLPKVPADRNLNDVITQWLVKVVRENEIERAKAIATPPQASEEPSSPPSEPAASTAPEQLVFETV